MVSAIPIRIYLVIDLYHLLHVFIESKIHYGVISSYKPPLKDECRLFMAMIGAGQWAPQPRFDHINGWHHITGKTVFLAVYNRSESSVKSVPAYHLGYTVAIPWW